MILIIRKIALLIKNLLSIKLTILLVLITLTFASIIIFDRYPTKRTNIPEDRDTILTIFKASNLFFIKVNNIITHIKIAKKRKNISYHPKILLQYHTHNQKNLVYNMLIFLILYFLTAYLK